ncbi:MAG: hypothetical protein A2V70_17310 [Planctomycetes bacterium RBG_13_63_9]|nr:MAG: hypothetical protein A2V70_17310 [Planctomycetes bacterium RBG_13_63_9]
MKDQNEQEDHPQEDNAQSLTYMMDLDFGSRELWGPDELEAVLAHQLSAPLECDLGHLDKGLAGRLEAANSADGPPIRTFADLLHHPRPPVELLELTKRFAKACRSHRQSPLPDEIATVLYFLSIAVALTQCGRRITKMDDPSLGYSLDWGLKQPWLDEPTRELLRNARRAID